MWHAKKDCFLLSSLSIVTSESDPCLYCHHTTSSLLLLALYVDGLLIAGRGQADIDRLKRQLNQRFAMKDLGPTSTSLGLEITRDSPRQLLHLGQPSYIGYILAGFGMSDCKPAPTPLVLSPPSTPSSPSPPLTFRRNHRHPRPSAHLSRCARWLAQSFS